MNDDDFEAVRETIRHAAVSAVGAPEAAMAALMRIELRLAAERAARAAAEQQIAALREAIRLARHRDYEGGPCWCWVDAGYNHDSACQTLRALLAPPAAEGGAGGG